MMLEELKEWYKDEFDRADAIMTKIKEVNDETVIYPAGDKIRNEYFDVLLELTKLLFEKQSKLQNRTAKDFEIHIEVLTEVFELIQVENELSFDSWKSLLSEILFDTQEFLNGNNGIHYLAAPFRGIQYSKKKYSKTKISKYKEIYITYYLVLIGNLINEHTNSGKGIRYLYENKVLNYSDLPLQMSYPNRFFRNGRIALAKKAFQQLKIYIANEKYIRKNKKIDIGIIDFVWNIFGCTSIIECSLYVIPLAGPLSRGYKFMKSVKKVKELNKIKNTKKLKKRTDSFKKNKIKKTIRKGNIVKKFNERLSGIINLMKSKKTVFYLMSKTQEITESTVRQYIVDVALGTNLMTKQNYIVSGVKKRLIYETVKTGVSNIKFNGISLAAIVSMRKNDFFIKFIGTKNWGEDLKAYLYYKFLIDFLTITIVKNIKSGKIPLIKNSRLDFPDMADLSRALAKSILGIAIDFHIYTKKKARTMEKIVESQLLKILAQMSIQTSFR